LYDQRVKTEGTYIGEVRFEGVADAGEVSRHRLWVDVVTHEDDKEREGVNSQTDMAVMELAKCEVRLEV